jgi:signal transduction histidine kinase
VSRTRALLGRWTDRGRNALRTPGLPLTAAALLALIAMSEVTARLPAETHRPLDASGVLLPALGTTLPLALVRTHVLTAALAITTGGVLALAGEPPPVLAGLVAQGLVLLALGLRRPLLSALPVVLPFAGYALLETPQDRRFLVPMIAVCGAAFGLGAAVRARLRTVRRGASRQALAESLVEHAARGERARIARELHDVVAHHISMIAVQAENARLATPGMPPEGEKKLLAIGDTARAALAEMRRVLGVLRADADADTGTRSPQPGLQHLVELIDEARDSSGASTRLIVRGRVARLDPGLELTAYRIVQEALTNARRHAPGAAVDVELDYEPATLRLRVRDNGPGFAASGNGAGGAGHGLAGMRERAAMVGGSLRVLSAPGSGVVVEAGLPVTRPEP